MGEEKERVRASLEPVFEFIKEFQIMNPFPLFVVEALPGGEEIDGKDLGKAETQISFALVDEIRIGLDPKKRTSSESEFPSHHNTKRIVGMDLLKDEKQTFVLVLDVAAALS